jgi:hypothetical protein
MYDSSYLMLYYFYSNKKPECSKNENIKNINKKQTLIESVTYDFTRIIKEYFGYNRRSQSIDSTASTEKVFNYSDVYK